jgi:hypothetical protein
VQKELIKVFKVLIEEIIKEKISQNGLIL